MKKNFLWGVATASYQIEGGFDSDGKKLSIWDTFTRIPGRIEDDSNGDVTCDHYHLYKEDIKLMKEMGLKSYRLSLSWSRIIPDGIGEVNQLGVKFYRDLFTELVKNDIIPLVTLYHWDMPEALDSKGGFLNPDYPKWFEYYAEVVTKEFKDLVKYYITYNEPQCIFNLGHNTLEHAPGIKYSDKDMLIAIHNFLLSHGRAVKVIRKNVSDSKVAFAPCSTVTIPKRNDPKLIEECYKKYFCLNTVDFAGSITIYSDPVYLGDYPKEYYELFKDILPIITKDDLELIHQPLDYCCQNIYTGVFYDLDENGKLVKLQFPNGYPESNIWWGYVVPESMYWGPKFLYERYKLPIIITENGMCCHDAVSLDGKVHDSNRINWLERYIIELERVSKEIPVEGYFVWSFMDNFEWAMGYKKRFGLVYVDYSSLERIPKDSYYFYQNVILNNGVKR